MLGGVAEGRQNLIDGEAVSKHSQHPGVRFGEESETGWRIAI